MPRRARRYDAAICLYHDQALIPVKTLDFWGGVNATLGLPIVRTSPDHGVGYDIAGRGLARADSLIAAIRLAAEMAARRGGVSTAEPRRPAAAARRLGRRTACWPTSGSASTSCSTSTSPARSPAWPRRWRMRW